MPVLWCSGPLLVPIGAAVVDFVVGDPWNWLHPVQVMGWGIRRYQNLVWQYCRSSLGQRCLGVVLGAGLPLLSGAIAIALIALFTTIHPVLGWAVNVITLASCWAGRSLRRAAADVLQPLEAGDLPTARQCLSLYVGRDTADLSETEILRAVFETVSENATDGVLAPLFYGLLGLAIAPPLGGGFAIAYKALSTLDSMVGYRTPPFADLGWFSARCEDVATWLPCRLTVLTIALLSGMPRKVWQLCCRDAPADPSPNAGWSECAYAAAVGVQLGGPNRYRGVVTQKPLLAEPTRAISPAIVQHALSLTRWAFLAWLGLGAIVLWGRYPLNC